MVKMTLSLDMVISCYCCLFLFKKRQLYFLLLKFKTYITLFYFDYMIECSDYTLQTNVRVYIYNICVYKYLGSYLSLLNSPRSFQNAKKRRVKRTVPSKTVSNIKIYFKVYQLYKHTTFMTFAILLQAVSEGDFCF